MRIIKLISVFLPSLTYTVCNAVPLRIVGSSAVFPFAATVAEHLKYKDNIPAPIVEAIGTGAGVKIFCEDLNGPDGAITSRPMTKSEKKKCKNKGITFEEFKIGQDGLILIQSQKSTGFSLSLRKLAHALLENISLHNKCTENPYMLWSDIDPTFPHYKIRVLGPAPTSGTYDVLIEKISGPCGSLLRQDGTYVEAPANENLIVQKIVRSPKSVGIITFSFFEQNKGKVQAFPINRVEPSLLTIQNGTYPLSRPLFLYMKTNASSNFATRKTYAVEFTSDSAIGKNGYLVKKGLIPLRKQEQKIVSRRAQDLNPGEKK